MKGFSSIINIDQLEIALGKDVLKHTLNDIANLLVNAMNDWPTTDLINIGNYLMEVKQIYGYPITIEQIRKTELDLSIAGNSWKGESISSIVDLIKLSNSIGIGTDLETIVQVLINFYENRENRIIVDGNKFETLSGFYNQIAKQLKKGKCPWGENLDSLDEIVSENFNYTDDLTLNIQQIIWINFTKSKANLTEKRGEQEVINIIEEIFTSNKSINLQKMPTA